jgi:hypothetical protein
MLGLLFVKGMQNFNKNAHKVYFILPFEKGAKF